MSNPFEEWQLGAVSTGGRISVSLLVQAAIGGTIDDRATDHAEDLFEELDERGPESHREAALLLVQHLVSSHSFGSGELASEQYLARYAIVDERMPALVLMHRAMAAHIVGGDEQATELLKDAELPALQGAVRYLFVMAVSASGYPSNQLEGLLDTLLGGAR